ncbi:hypothetical protein Hokovirus_1_102 [Hokovirus HKV1]|uniref:Uncharacterized protein n=1 Tax=Hokovirus HKV1 TaxID=1977638 RepID=A0A1V0SES6_9VIRU|nr:hypothetical protein Hokovirus_1_102 [Hokovirus HKV1]
MEQTRYYEKYNINIDNRLIKKTSKKNKTNIKLTFVKNTNNIYHNNKNIHDDYHQIQLKGFVPVKSILNIVDDSDKCIIEAFNSNIIRIHYKHKINNDNIFDLYVSLEGIKGEYSKYFNTKHKLFTQIDETFTYNPEYFYIKLPIIINEFNVQDDYLFTLHKHYIGGISIDFLNSIKYTVNDYILEMPITFYNLIQYDENITLHLEIIPFINYCSTDIFNLGKTYNNIQSLKLTSSEFPNVKNYILINNNNNTDNIILFKYLDKRILIHIPCGFYSVQQLSSLISKTINESVDDNYHFYHKIINKNNEFYIKFYLFLKQKNVNDLNNNCYIFVNNKYKKYNIINNNIEYIFTLVSYSFEVNNLTCQNLLNLNSCSLFKLKYYFKLYEYNYFYMTINQFNTYEYSGLDIKPFAKIQLGTNELTNNKTLFNTFVDSVKNYISPVISVSALYIDFYDPFGNKIDFFNLNYSFSLEMTCVFNLPNGTLINPKTSQNYAARYDSVV